ncbi:hypothetical protein RND71_034037 [Anisodus tanguticus]|uniref:Uncharacterized protein n=1 Tax=Anisodus tanguticus TaxID=243964 RepID=A0AAE1R9X1_9SOLA|nr:hypothetical protein RND71_034037 [Anisodus tanguticus]
MKKKQKSTTISAAATTDLKALIGDHILFFDNLIDLIPPRFYLPKDEPDTWYRGLPKAAKASLKKQSKDNLKLARRNRLDPEKKDQSSTLGLLEQSLKTKQNAENSVEEDHIESKPINLEENDNPNPNPNNDNASVTYEELRQRLRRKIEMLRGNRGDGEGLESNRARKRSEKDETLSKFEGKKRKRGEQGEEGQEDTSVEKEIEFGKVKLGDDDDKKKKKKVSKAKELERLKRLEEVKRENRTLADKEAWKAAANKAMGVKVYDNPKLLKESMKKEKRRKEKSSEKWKERMETTEKLQKERQQKRRDNIAGKAKEKKMRKIAKREKKLMRPGFEGRKEGYITQDKS